MNNLTKKLADDEAELLRGLLRDWFAGQALAGMVSGGWVPGDEDKCAARLYSIADAMLREREKQ